MPELPDVEVFRRYLDSIALHHKIKDVEIRAETLIKDITPRKFIKSLLNRTLEESRRHGKYCFVRLDSKEWLVMHFGMTGFLHYFKSGEQEPGHSGVLLHFDNSHTLAYVSQRKLGRIGLVQDMREYIRERSLGPDALEIDKDSFIKILSRSGSMIKSALMRQENIAGIGNVYSDEILFQAGIHPKAQIKNLDRKALDKLYRTTRRVLETAIDKSADPARFPAEFIIPIRGSDNACPKCSGKPEKIKVSGRTGWYCPQCQKEQ